MVIVGVIIGVLTVIIVALITGLYRSYKGAALDRFYQYIEDEKLNKKEMTIYTPGQREIWSRISFEDTIQKIKDDCWLCFSPLPIPKRSQFLVRVDNKRNALQIVFTTKKQFNWSTLRYSEELESK